jgi:gliding motility-associated-like protein
MSSVKVKLYDCDKCLFVPSAFTPNNDGLNDVFHIRMVCPIRHFGIKVFNRFGQVVYTSYYLNQGWDGKFNGEPVDIGTYLYEITYTPDLLNAHELHKKGDVTVIR